MASVEQLVDAMVRWLHERRGILTRIELAIHDDGAWTGQTFVIEPEQEPT